VAPNLNQTASAEDDVIERESGTEEESSLDGAAGDEDEGLRVGDVT
jgi:hypothetical protein